MKTFAGNRIIHSPALKPPRARLGSGFVSAALSSLARRRSSRILHEGAAHRPGDPPDPTFRFVLNSSTRTLGEPLIVRARARALARGRSAPGNGIMEMAVRAARALPRTARDAEVKNGAILCEAAPLPDRYLVGASGNHHPRSVSLTNRSQPCVKSGPLDRRDDVESTCGGGRGPAKNGEEKEKMRPMQRSSAHARAQNAMGKDNGR